MTGWDIRPFVLYNAVWHLETKEVTLTHDQLQLVLGNADTIKALIAKREQLILDLAAADAELEPFTNAPVVTRTRAKQKCSLCGSEEHNKKTSPQMKAAA